MRDVDGYEYAYTNFKPLKSIKISDLVNQVHVNKYMSPFFVEWCTANCCYPWGWWIVGAEIYLGFIDPDEKLLFCVSNDY